MNEGIVLELIPHELKDYENPNYCGACSSNTRDCDGYNLWVQPTIETWGYNTEQRKPRRVKFPAIKRVTVVG